VADDGGVVVVADGAVVVGCVAAEGGVVVGVDGAVVVVGGVVVVDGVVTVGVELGVTGIGGSGSVVTGAVGTYAPSGGMMRLDALRASILGFDSR
jgi:hypothetical protein